ncbi:hypothetical protein MVEN_00223300 [Mycena venus]|uniref:Uncharacterized protein n=1 Tax=Mycena venus TaxID=2733690 RepID=A0A8H6YXM8_9AGAR|nr:hypothetical protein MVEN_00223300 [Mycena venus]
MTLSIRVSPAEADPLLYTGSLAEFPNITRLVLIYSCDQSAPLIDVVCHFPALQELHIRDVRRHALADPSASAVPPRELRSLALSAHSMGPILVWLQACGHLPEVHSLTLRWLPTANLFIVRVALQALGGALRHLDIDMKPFFSVYSTFDFTPHHNLETVILRDSGRVLRPKDSIILMINRLVAPKLERLELHLNLSRLGHAILDWAAVDMYLSSGQFPRLQSVLLKCSTQGHDHGDHDFLRNALPSLGSEVFRTDW